MLDDSTDHGSGLYDAPTRPIPMHRPQSLLGGEPPDYRAPVIDDYQPVVHPVSVFDRVESRTVGLLASMVLGGLLLIVVAVTVLSGGGEASTETAGSGVVSGPVAQAPDPSSADAAAAGQLLSTSTSTSALPSSLTSMPVDSSATVSSTSAPSSTTTAAPTTAAAPTTTAPPATTASTTTAPPSTPAPETSEASSTTAMETSTTMGSSTTVTPSSDTTMSTPSTTVGDPTTPSTTAGPSGDDAAIQQQVLDATNAARAANGCGPLTLDPLLNRAADGHSEDMAARDYFSHTDPEGRGPGFRIDAVGYPHRGWAENIAAGHGSPQAVVDGWMNSSGHRTNILNCAYDQLGVGYAESGRYWTQVLATRS